MRQTSTGRKLTSWLPDTGSGTPPPRLVSGGSTDLFAVAVSTAGVVLDEEPIAIATSPRTEARVRLAASPGNGWLAVWEDYRQDLLKADVYATHSLRRDEPRRGEADSDRGRARGTPSTRCPAYVCGGASVACPTACVTDGDCASGYGCDLQTSACVPTTSCDGEHTLVGPQGKVDCAPYRCQAAGCLTTCRDVQDCAYPAVCDEAGACVAAGAPPTDTSGCDCGVTSRGAPRSLVWLAFVPGLASVRARRRRGIR